jgi:ABC-type Fe3+-hydroxamate transport system substrate-binding protein
MQIAQQVTTEVSDAIAHATTAATLYRSWEQIALHNPDIYIVMGILLSTPESYDQSLSNKVSAYRKSI